MKSVNLIGKLTILFAILLLGGVGFLHTVAFRVVSLPLAPIILLSVLTYGLAILSVYLSIRAILAPLNTITEAIKQFSRGHKSMAVAIQTHDEFGLLAKTFESMSRNIEYHMNTLKEREELIRISEERLKLALEASGSGLWDWDITRDESYWSPTYYAMLGYAYNEVPASGDTFATLLHPDDKERVFRGLDQAQQTGDTYEIEFRLRTTSGRWRWVFSRGQVVSWGRDGHAQRMIGTHVDITDRKEMEDALQRSQESYQMLADLSQDLISLHDANGDYLYASPACRTLLGYEPDELIGHGAYEYLHPTDVDNIVHHYQHTREGEQMPPIAYRIRKKDGTYIWFETTNRFQCHPQTSEVEKILCVSRDISERKKTETRLRLLLRLTQAIDQAHDFYAALEVVLRDFCETSHWAYGEVWIPDQEKNILQSAPVWYSSHPEHTHSFREATERLTFTPHTGLPGRVWSSRTPEWIPDVSRESTHIFQRHEVAQNVGFRAGFGVPIVSEQEVLAVLVFFLREAKEEHQEWLELIASVAIQLGSLIQRKHHEEQLAAYRNHLEDLVEARTAQLRESESRFRTLVDSMNDIVFTLDTQQRHTGVFGQWVEKQELTPELFLGKRSREILGPEAAAVHETANSKALQGQPVVYEWTVSDATGALQYFQTSLSPMYDDEGYVSGLVGVGRDITALRQAEEALKRARDEAEEARRVAEKAQRASEAAQRASERANQAKSEFLANMSHELRTPLNAILGYTQLLTRNTSLTDYQQKAIQTIHRSSEHLLMMINDILDLSKIEARKMELLPQNIYLPDFLNATVELIRIRAEQRQIAFEHEFDPTLPEGVLVDEKRLRQVLLNLLGNAVKFTNPGGRVTFKVTKVEGEAGQAAIATLQFSIADTGVGIPADQLDQIFLAFQQVGSLHDRAEGTGLGLAISRQLVGMMGGELQVMSTVRQGSTFWFVLQLPLVSALAASSQQDALEHIVGFHGPPKTILLADDHQENRKILADMLQPLGFHILEARDEAEMMRIVRQSSPDLIFMDLNLPGMESVEIMWHIQETPPGPDTIIIAMSVDVYGSDQQHRFAAAGCQEFLTKPLRFKDILKALERSLHLEWRYAPSSEPNQSLKSSSDAVIIAPPEEDVRLLLEAAQIGDISELKTWISKVDGRGPALQPFVERLKRFCETYEFEELFAFLQQQAKTAPV